jgi:hypothetical protein
MLAIVGSRPRVVVEAAEARLCDPSVVKTLNTFGFVAGNYKKVIVT